MLCISICVFKEDFAKNPLLHFSHIKGFILEWTYLRRFKRLFRRNSLVQMSQAKLFTLEWICMCAFKYQLAENTLLHILQINGIFGSMFIWTTFDDNDKENSNKIWRKFFLPNRQNMIVITMHREKWNSKKLLKATLKIQIKWSKYILYYTFHSKNLHYVWMKHSILQMNLLKSVPCAPHKVKSLFWHAHVVINKFIHDFT